MPPAIATVRSRVDDSLNAPVKFGQVVVQATERAPYPPATLEGERRDMTETQSEHLFIFTNSEVRS
jgi:hypothetical protein